MSIRNRLKKLERNIAPQYISKRDQEESLRVFIEIETAFNGRRPTESEIEEERQRLAQPIKDKKYTHEEWQQLNDEVERLFDKYARGEGDKGVV